MRRVASSIALVTGANRGIGKAIVEELLVRGASKVYVGVRNPAPRSRSSHSTATAPCSMAAMAAAG